MNGALVSYIIVIPCNSGTLFCSISSAKIKQNNLRNETLTESALNVE